ncbi:MAG: von Willebrand factor type A domain-containing protein [Acidobacteriota bacterium]
MTRHENSPDAFEDMSLEDVTFEGNLARRLESFDAPEPPSGLLDAIRDEIPAELPVANLQGSAADGGAAQNSGPEGGKVAASSAAPPARPRFRGPLRLAAIFVVALMGAAIAWQVSQQNAPLELQDSDPAFTERPQPGNASESPAAPTQRGVESAPLDPADSEAAPSGATSSGPTTSGSAPSPSAPDSAAVPVPAPVADSAEAAEGSENARLISRRELQADLRPAPGRSAPEPPAEPESTTDRDRGARLASEPLVGPAVDPRFAAGSEDRALARKGEVSEGLEMRDKSLALDDVVIAPPSPPPPAPSAPAPPSAQVRRQRADEIPKPRLEELRKQAEVLREVAEAPTVQEESSAYPPGNYRWDSGSLNRRAEALEAEMKALDEETLSVTSEVGAVAPPSSAPPSTGGSAEPNDQPYGDVFYESAGVNPFVDTEDDALSTFGLDVDTGSWGVVRRYLRDGHLPPPDAVRVEEIVNAFDYGDAAPEEEAFAISVEGAPTPFIETRRTRLLRIGVQGREVHRADRKPATLVFVVDVSGSMGRENRLGLVRRSLHLLLDNLGPQDRVGLVVYGSRGQVLQSPTGDLRRLRAAIDRLVPSGSTNAEEGLSQAYDLIQRYQRSGAIHRLILCSDGVANVGATGPESILRRVRSAADEGVELTTLGFGMGNYNDHLMEQLANQGDGRYAYLDTLDDAHRLFVEELTGTLQTIAAEARAQVEFDPQHVERWRLLGYENRDIADRDFRNDSIDAGEIGAGHTVTALYEVKLSDDARRGDRLGTVRLRYRNPETERFEEIQQPIRGRDIASSFRAASPSLRLAAVAGEFAEILRRSYWARGSDLGLLLREGQALAADNPRSRDLAELNEQLARALRLRGRGGDFED